MPDNALQKARDTESEIVLSDWDGTLRSGFTIIDWLQHLALQGVVDSAAPSKALDALSVYQNGGIGYLDFARRVVQHYGASIRGVHQQILATEALKFVDADQSMHPFASALISELAGDYHLVVISGGPSEVLEAYFSGTAGVEIFGVLLKFSGDGVATGEITSNPALTDTKQLLAKQVLGNRFARAAIGDSEADRPLLEAALIKIVVGKSLPTWTSADVLLIDPSAPSADSLSKIRAGLLKGNK